MPDNIEGFVHLVKGQEGGGVREIKSACFWEAVDDVDGGTGTMGGYYDGQQKKCCKCHQKLLLIFFLLSEKENI